MQALSGGNTVIGVSVHAAVLLWWSSDQGGAVIKVEITVWKVVGSYPRLSQAKHRADVYQ